MEVAQLLSGLEPQRLPVLGQLLQRLVLDGLDGARHRVHPHAHNLRAGPHHGRDPLPRHLALRHSLGAELALVF